MPTSPTVDLVRANDDGLAAYVHEAELAPLLVALAQATGDLSLIRRELMPPLVPSDPFPGPQRGMTSEQLERGRAAAVKALAKLRENDNLKPLGPESTETLLNFLTGGASDDYMPLLKHELGLTPKKSHNNAELADFNVAIIGGGVSGLAAARQMSLDGVNFTLIEKSPQIGGTWWKNRYPGCRLDTDNYTYSYSFEHKEAWPNQFSLRADIQAYLDDVATSLNPEENFRLGTEVLSASFDDESFLWNLQLRNADGSLETLTVNAVITAMGQLDRPHIPDFPGQDSFAGAAFHTAEWDPSIELENKRVAVIGSGASAFQVVPAVVDSVKALTVFQRNAPWMSPTPNYCDPTPPGVLELLRHVPNFARWLRINRLWVMVDGRRSYAIADPNWEKTDSVSASNEFLRQELGQYIAGQYDRKPELIENAIPNYPPFAKRMLRDNGSWADALQQPHTTVVAEGIEQLTPGGIVSRNGVEHLADVIIYATGFLAAEFLEPLSIKGRGGVDLHEQWKGDSKAFLGVSIPNFPNLFVVGGPNTGLVAYGSYHLFAESAVNYISECISAIRRQGIHAIDLKWDVYEAFNAEVDAANEQMAWGVSTVPSWYKNATGRVSQVWPFSTLEFWNRTRNVDIENYEVL